MNSSERIAVKYLEKIEVHRKAADEEQKNLEWGVRKLNTALDDIEEVLVHWAPKGRKYGLADDHKEVSDAVNSMYQVGSILGPHIKKLQQIKIKASFNPQPTDQEEGTLAFGAIVE